MEKVSQNLKEHELELKAAAKLFGNAYDCLIFIDADTGLLIKTPDAILDTISSADYLGGKVYNDQIPVILPKPMLDFTFRELKRSMQLSVVKKELEIQDFYNLDFYIDPEDGSARKYKRICFCYVGSGKHIITLSIRDITNIILCGIDPTTGLYNFMGFHKQVRKWMAEHPGQKYRIYRYDIDNFKDINGIYGYEASNKLLYDIGRFMKGHDNEDSFSGHMGADHFVRFCADYCESPESCYESFCNDFKDYDLNIPLSLHVGVYDLCEEGNSSYTMSYKALLALKTIKGNFLKHVAYYRKEMMVAEFENQELLKKAESALRNGEFEVWFQPQVDYSSGSLIGAEALIRWRHPTKGLLAPGSFISLLESNDFIILLDEYVLDKACMYLRKWMDEMPGKDICLSVNISRKDLNRKNYNKFLLDTVEKYNIPRDKLHLEITESAYTDNPKLLISVVKWFKKEGFTVEMDDFGSGYSSLNLLKDIDTDTLKLDMGFLYGNNDTPKGRKILSSVIDMASALSLNVIAEGVETKEQADMLLRFGCKYMQGYYFSKPIPANEYEKLLTRANK